MRDTCRAFVLICILKIIIIIIIIIMLFLDSVFGLKLFNQFDFECKYLLQKRPRADILPVRSRASLVNKRFITRLVLKKTAKVFRKFRVMIMRDMFRRIIRRLFCLRAYHVYSFWLCLTKKTNRLISSVSRNVGSFGTMPVQCLENIGPLIERFDWLILVIGPLTG